MPAIPFLIGIIVTLFSVKKNRLLASGAIAGITVAVLCGVLLKKQLVVKKTEPVAEQSIVDDAEQETNKPVAEAGVDAEVVADPEVEADSVPTLAESMKDYQQEMESLHQEMDDLRGKVAAIRARIKFE